jgi:hypothetical protein
MIDRLVCADGGNPDPTSTAGKNASLAKTLEFADWDYPEHLAGRACGLIVHADVAGVDGVRRDLSDWLDWMGLIDADAKSRLDRYIGDDAPYATRHDARDGDAALQEEVRKVARAVAKAVVELGAGRLQAVQPTAPLVSRGPTRQAAAPVRADGPDASSRRLQQPLENAMHNPKPTAAALAALVIAAAVLTGCGPAAGPAPAPAPMPAAQPAPPPPVAADSSVPAADAVAITPAIAASAQQPATRSNRAMTRAEESAAMPMAGQANDQSAPLPAAKRSSAP